MSGKNNSSEFDAARNDLFSHIHRCGVLRATEEQQIEWMKDTTEYIGECFPALSAEDVEELQVIGLRFCRPVIAHGKNNTALETDSENSSEAADAEVETEEVSTV